MKRITVKDLNGEITEFLTEEFSIANGMVCLTFDMSTPTHYQVLILNNQISLEVMELSS